jgi:hypothetical protein
MANLDKIYEKISQLKNLKIVLILQGVIFKCFVCKKGVVGRGSMLLVAWICLFDILS